MLLPAIFESVFGEPGPHYRKREPIFDFFDDTPVVKIRREYVKPVVDESDFVLRVDCRGYSPENLKITIDKNLLVVEGHVVAGDLDSDAGTLERNFIRRIPIPEEVNRETFKNEFKNGKLVITAEKKKKQKTESGKVSIPINFVAKSVTPPPTPQKEEVQPLEEPSPEKKELEEPKGEDKEAKVIPTEDPDVVVVEVQQ